ncbi:MAG: hypothetical protein U0T83_08090 [Bacteriovoracaceae bacterium]
MFKKLFQKKKKPAVSRQRRVKIIPLHHMKLELKINDQWKNYQIENTSVGGIGIVNDNFPEELKEVVGKLTINKKVLELKLSVRHVSEEFVGFQIENNQESGFQKVVEEYLMHELEIAKMKEVKPENMRQPKIGKMRWWNGGENCDFSINYNDDVIIEFSLTFLGNVISGSHKSPTILMPLNERALNKKDPILLNSDLKASLIKFINNIENLDTKLKEQLELIILN